MPKKTLIFLILILSFGLLVFNFFKTEEVKAGSGDNVWGWAWSNMYRAAVDPDGPHDPTIGWISFNCTDREVTTGKTCVTTVLDPATELWDYGVNIEADGTFEGYAWSENIGWISFNEAELSGCPALPCKAQVDLGTGQVSGWARALAYDGGWDGWIKLSGTWTDGVSINTVSGHFSGWAWSDMVIGWISFNCADTGACPPDYKVMTSFSSNQPPNQPASAGVTWGLECVRTMAVPAFAWVYSDNDDVPPGTDPQTACEIRVGTDSTFPVDASDDPIIEASEFTCSGSICSGGSAPSFAPIDGEWIAWASFNTLYYWTVRVKDSNNNWSDWMVPDDFTTPEHTYPEPDFTHSPTIPLVGQVVTFTDDSICYDGINNPYPCSDLNPITGTYNDYEWDFEDDGSIDSNDRGDATSTYATAGEYTVRLYVTDDLGTCDTTGSTPITITLPLPEYREVAPVGQSDSFLARIANIFVRF